MTWEHRCPRCGVVSLRHCPLDRKPVCSHLYHAPEDCGVCGDCRCANHHYELTLTGQIAGTDIVQ